MRLNPFHSFAASLLVCVLLFAGKAIGSTLSWSLSDAPSYQWYGLACTADGNTVFAASGLGRLYMSTNGGFGWNVMPQPVLSDLNWGMSTGVSADGAHIILATAGANVLVSNDSGNDWHVLPNLPGTSVACSSDGSIMLAAAPLQFPPLNGTIAISTDYGASWKFTSAPRANWSRVICSADGSQLVAASASGVYTSVDSGQSWASNSVPPSGNIAASADGKRLILASGQIYASTNSGASWNLLTNSPRQSYWEGVASSADGMKLAAVAYQAPIFTSCDGGTTWTSNAAPTLQWFGVTSSADGNRLTASAGGSGGIWAAQETPAPKLNILHSGTRVVIFWIIPSTHFVLQQSEDLKTSNWSDVVTQPTLNYATLNYEVRLQSSSSALFFRLVEQP